MTTRRARVAYAELRPLSGRMAQPVGNAHARWPQREGLLLCLVDDCGAAGLGEATPLPGYSAEDLATCRAQLQQVPWGELELDLDVSRRALPDEFPLPLAGEGQGEGARAGTTPSPRLSRERERGRAALWRQSSLPVLGSATARCLARLVPAARCAAETALLALIAQHRAIPLATLLRGETPPAAVAVSSLLTGDSVAELLASAHAAIARGFRTLKIKVGRPDGAAWELAALRELRRQLDPTIALRLDANRAWSLATATERLAALAELAPELIEEPLANVRELPQLRTSVRIALDESLQHLDMELDVGPLLASGTVRALVLKPMALGGPLRCLQLAQLAAAHGVPALVTHLFDGTVAMAAAAALALALPAPLACGLAAHSGLALGPAVLPEFVDAPQVTPAARPGLGIELTAQSLAQPCLWSTRAAASGD